MSNCPDCGRLTKNGRCLRCDRWDPPSSSDELSSVGTVCEAMTGDNTTSQQSPSPNESSPGGGAEARSDPLWERVEAWRARSQSYKDAVHPTLTMGYSREIDACANELAALLEGHHRVRWGLDKDGGTYKVGDEYFFPDKTTEDTR